MGLTNKGERQGVTRQSSQSPEDAHVGRRKKYQDVPGNTLVRRRPHKTLTAFRGRRAGRNRVFSVITIIIQGYKIRGHILKPSCAPAHIFDTLFEGVLGISKGCLVALAVVWPFFYAMSVKKTFMKTRLISFLTSGYSWFERRKRLRTPPQVLSSLPRFIVRKSSCFLRHFLDSVTWLGLFRHRQLLNLFPFRYFHNNCSGLQNPALSSQSVYKITFFLSHNSFYVFHYPFLTLHDIEIF